ncbi:corrinoid ABC transporter substrate-binding protein [Caulifigura coniformis]|uniref:Corrinoid ABC transporter substrate-binding protein n=1 Tax=Caulifigura coniformis TaxID=2527983 RepID=A0A517SJZ8_9PLAN|nr:cobalamin-binding protein [Caulifigura coniformis]QDT56453.1 corrinoid ABC transporter substrate-binding protein [Caulifigura coniformis]
MRIVSLLPSATEIVCELGLGDQLVGVTHECDFPAGVSGLPHLTRTRLSPTASSSDIDAQVREQLSTRNSLYELDHDLLVELKPDLIVTQSLCDVCAVSEQDVRNALCRLPTGAQVVNLEPQRLDEVLDSLEAVAAAAGAPSRGVQARRGLEERIDSVIRSVAEPGDPGAAERPRVVVLEWIDPPFSAGHWVPEIVELAGGREMIGQPGERSVTLSWEEVVAARPDVCFISCCGFSIERTKLDLPVLFEHVAGHDLPCVQNGKIFVLDGSAFLSRPGPRLVTALELMAWALSPERVQRPQETTGIERVPVKKWNTEPGPADVVCGT